MIISVENAHDAVHKACELIVDLGTSVDSVTSLASIGSAFGQRARPFREALGVIIRVVNPLDRLLPTECTPFDLGYAVANFIWSITPGAPPEQILAYNRKGSSLLDDNGEFACAVPHRLAGHTPNHNYLSDLLELIRADPTTRRAIVPLIREDDLVSQPKDLPCIASFQVFVRGGKVHALTHMRSQSALAIMPYDMFVFTMLQESIALHLERPVGEYIHMVNSLHIYEEDGWRYQKVRNCSASVIPMARMDQPGAVNAELAAAEMGVRTGLSANLESLSPYWHDLFDTMRARLEVSGA